MTLNFKFRTICGHVLQSREFSVFYYTTLLYKLQAYDGKGRLSPIELNFFVNSHMGIPIPEKKEGDQMSLSKKGAELLP